MKTDGAVRRRGAALVRKKLIDAREKKQNKVGREHENERVKKKLRILLNFFINSSWDTVWIEVESWGLTGYLRQK